VTVLGKVTLMLKIEENVTLAQYTNLLFERARESFFLSKIVIY